MKCVKFYPNGDKVPEALKRAFGSTVGAWLFKQVSDFVDEDFHEQFEHADNFRVADMTNKSMIQHVDATEGCCGSSRWTFCHPSGKYFLLAWNYGH